MNLATTGAAPDKPGIHADAVLIQATLPEGDDACLTGLLADLQTSGLQQPLEVHAVQAVLAPTKMSLYEYLHFSRRQLLDQAAVSVLASPLQGRWPQLHQLQVSRLEKLFETQQASAGSAPVFHYAVEMDPENRLDAGAGRLVRQRAHAGAGQGARLHPCHPLPQP